MKTRNILFFGLFLINFLSVNAQCELKLSGRIIDNVTDTPLEFVSIYVEETEGGAYTDSSGYFQIPGLCKQAYHLRLSHLSCEPVRLFLSMESDTFLQIRLNHHAELLDEIVLHGAESPLGTQISSTIKHENIARESDKSFSDILSNISGVSSLKTGSEVSKPIIHGLSGNRISIVNNGIIQAGQSWGNDHAPEVDPYISDHISVIKGAGALEYGGNALGNVVLIESSKIRADPHLHGQVNYVFNSNGFAQTLNTKIQKSSHWADWKLSGSLRYSGDKKTPDYFLTNTGKREANFAIQVDKQLTSRWETGLYYSLFTTEIGILRGAHIGNLSDLEEAIGRSEPFYTEDDFSFDISAPRQEVTHHLLKLEANYFIDQQKLLKIRYGGQLNQRKEYDVRRSGRSDKPALSLDQYAHNMEGIFQYAPDPNNLMKFGLQFRFTDNTNNPETGILPLIPDFQMLNPAGFFIIQNNKRKINYELGARYDLRHVDAVTITSTSPRTIKRFENSYNNVGLHFGSAFPIIKSLKSKLNLSFNQRAPGINELYSFGLHQGVSGIEEGNLELNDERSLKLLWTLNLFHREKLFLESTAYYQKIDGYIFLEPQNEYRLTIRGAFPLFVYKQTNAAIYGMDLLLKYEPDKYWIALFKYALTRGRDISQNSDLVYIPADNIHASLQYRFNEKLKLRDAYLAFDTEVNFEQSRYNPNLDFLPPPEGYVLLGLKGGFKIYLEASILHFNLTMENMMNKRYRNYLNRQRYFADETGRAIKFNVLFDF